MTCVIGYIDKNNNEVVLGSDSIAVKPDHSKTIRSKSKLIQHDSGLVIGFCGSFRQADIIEFHLELSELEEIDSLRKYVVKEFIPTLQKALSEHQNDAKSSDGIGVVDAMLIAFKGELVFVDFDYNVSDVKSFESIGAASDIAKGALYALDKSKMTGSNKVTKALEASFQFSGAVSPPFHILKV